MCRSMDAVVSRVSVNTCLLILSPTAGGAASLPGSLDDRASVLWNRMRILASVCDAGSPEDDMVWDVYERLEARKSDGKWSGLLQAERTIRWIDNRLSWLEARAGLSVL